ncbi:MAG: Abi family protein [Spiroplasma sp.]|nr:Abi family protein [Spiroplasma sp.]
MNRENKDKIIDEITLNTPREELDPRDLIVDVEEQIHFLIKKNLKITDQEELKHIIENYGFNRLFRRYSKPFITNINGEEKYKKNTTEITILQLYYFDYKLTNILIKYLGLLEAKLTSNITHSLDLQIPNVVNQASFFSRKRLRNTKNIIKTNAKNGSTYLQTFVDADIYPGWVLLGNMPFGDKLFLFPKLKNTNSTLKNFYLEGFDNNSFKTIFFDFIRPFRNISAHFDRLLKFHVQLNSNQISIFKTFMKKIIPNSNYFNKTMIKNKNKVHSFDLILMLTYLLGSSAAEVFFEVLTEFISKEKVNINGFLVEEFLVDEKLYNWPNEWKEILLNVLQAKTKDESSKFNNLYKSDIPQEEDITK